MTEQERQRAYELLQPVADSYARTANLKRDYEQYQALLIMENSPSPIYLHSSGPLTMEERERLQEYKERFASYEENVRQGANWYAKR